MGKIIKLTKDVIEKIAAGEVVERPASVVKECIENSIDAGATSIRIEIERGGKSSIVCQDNGEGITKEDLILAVQRHTTSKIASVKDLFRIRNLGFRGEALASIAAVSRFSIISNPMDSNSIGWRLDIVDDEQNLREVVANKGTTVIVKDLFYNTPARRKFLSSEVAELKQVIEIVTSYALSYPEISFSLKHNKAELLNFPATNDLLKRILQVYGKDIAKGMVAVTHKNSIEIQGFVGAPEVARKTRDYESFFVNRRYVRSKLLQDAVESAYKTLLFLDKKPVLVLNIKIAPEKIDVNVHPTKLEIKFDNEDTVFSELHLAVKHALSTKQVIEKQAVSAAQALLKEKQRRQTQPAQRFIERSRQSMLVKEDNEKNFRVLGQLVKSYIIAEDAEGLLIVDQHAAAERINLEKLTKGLKGGKISQKLLQPIVVNVSKQNFHYIKDQLELLKQRGLEAEPFGTDGFLVRRVPVILGLKVTKSKLEGLFDALASGLKDIRKGLIRERVIETMACKSAIKANEELTEREMEALLEELYKTEHGFACAHGRPTLARLTLKDIEKMFRRT